MDVRPKGRPASDRECGRECDSRCCGKDIGYLGIAHDITKRKESESKLLLLTERLSLATSVAALGVWEWDVANSAMTWDATMVEIYGFSLSNESPYEQWSRSVYPDDCRRPKARWRK